LGRLSEVLDGAGIDIEICRHRSFDELAPHGFAEVSPPAKREYDDCRGTGTLELVGE
jgi:hypothetical protein